MPRWAYRALLSSILGLSLIASACGSSGGGSPASSSSSSKGTITIAGFNFSESSILANVYGGALKGEGYTINYKLNLGSREVVAPALQRGDIDLYPGYAATDLEYFDNSAGLATPDPAQTLAKLNSQIASKNLKALDTAPAIDTNAFAVLKSGKYGSDKKLSDLVSSAPQMTLGGPPECPTRPFCQKGLQTTYGLNFKDFKALDSDGPLTKSALDSGAIQVGLLFSSDGSITAKGYVVLDDDKHLQNADNIVPVIRNDKANADAQAALNKVSAALTSDKLAALNKQVDIDKADPADVAKKFLSDNGLA